MFFDPIPTDVFAAWGQWAGGLGSIAAVVVALWIVRRESIRTHRTEEAQRIGRAHAITAAYKTCPIDDPGQTFRYGIQVANHGSLPVIDVRVIKIAIVETIYSTADALQMRRSWNVDLRGALPVHVSDVLAADEGAFCEFLR
ncbi:hypothetical protein ACIRG5_47100 [Lentzea sp. NPDC102401]|uniref:hypothetical protein n=1 Tax=Lentzea sp. NPDC102401 TaxID=3364128 RepID=UPI0038171500